METKGRIVSLLHPGAVRLVPKGARADRVALLPMRTPVRIREVDEGEMRGVATVNALGSYHSYHAFEGGLWLKVEGIRFNHAPAYPSAEDVVAFLEGQPAPDLAGTDLLKALAGTPLAGPLRKGTRAFDDCDPDRARQVVDDARAECARGAARWASERIVLAGGHAYVRSWNPMAVLGENGASATLQRCLVEPFPADWRTRSYRPAPAQHLASELQGFPVRLDALPRTQAMLDRFHLVYDERRQMQQVRMDGIPTPLLGDDDLALMANLLPGLLLEQSRHAARALPAGADPTPLEAAREALRPLEVRGAAGLFGPDEAEDVIARARHLCEVAMDATRAGASPRYDAVLTWADEVALPRLRERRLAASVAPEDEEALEGLRGPWP